MSSMVMQPLSNYRVNLVTGFLPEQDPLTCLPPYFAPWERVAKQLSALLMVGKLRTALEQVPILDMQRLEDERKEAAKNAQDWDENREQKLLLAKIHERIGNRRLDFAHKRSRELVNTYQVIVFEDLAPQDMGKSRGMRKSIMDVAWTQFIRMTIGKAAEAGRTVILVDSRNTSKMCSQCGELVQKTLSARTHTCPKCGLVMDRDRNAALNILQRGLQTLRL
jgi:putative transposase